MPKDRPKSRRVMAEGAPVERGKEFVRVRATERGQWDQQIRNPGEVFLMDTALLKPMADVEPEEVDDANVITVGSVDYDLPSWVEPVTGEVEPGAEIARGHAPGTSSKDVI